jgi:pimeloyl-ACP methyl ester carboxylesterase
LVKGRERVYFEHFWNDLAADSTGSIPEADRQAYTESWGYFRSFQQTASDFAQLSRTKLTMPVLTIGGDKANGEALAKQAGLVATNATSVILGNTGHWVMEERRQETTDALLHFLAIPLSLPSDDAANTPKPAAAQ